MASMQVLYKRLREGDATKEDEIEILHKLSIAAFEAGAYMKHLFSADLLEWFRGKLRGDILPDLMGELEEAQARTRTAEGDAGDFEADMHDHESERDALRAKVVELEQALLDTQQADDERYSQDMAEKVNEIMQTKTRHQETIDELLLVERKLRAVRKVAGNAWLESRDVAADELKEALSAQPPIIPEWSSLNPHHYDEV